jgi:hypothetical protein
MATYFRAGPKGTTMLFLLNGHLVDLTYAGSRNYGGLGAHVLDPCFAILRLAADGRRTRN